MKVKALFLSAVFLTGLVASLAFAKPPKPPKPPKAGATTLATTTATEATDTTATETTNTTTTTTSEKPKCKHVELSGSASTGSTTFTVLKANKEGQSLVNTPVTLVIPAGAKVKAKVCSSGTGQPTLTDLHVKVAKH